MTAKIQTLLAVLIVPVTIGVLFVAAPVLTSGRPVVDEQAGRHVETARRMARQYSENAERLADLLAQLDQMGESPEMGSERINTLVEADRTLFEPALQQLKAINSNVNLMAQRDAESKFESMGGVIQGPLAPTGNFPASTGQMASLIRESLQQRDQLIAENERLLTSAISELDQAMNVTSGSLSGRDLASVSRLKGAVQLVQAARDVRKANLLALQAEEARERLNDLANKAAHLATESNVLEASGIGAKIEEQRSASLELQESIEDTEAQARQLAGTISDLEARIAGFRDRATQARATMDRLEAEGVDMTNPNGADVFATAYAEAATQFREATSSAHRLERGTLENARIDDSMDYVLGKYEPADGGEIVVERGLIDYRDDQEKLAVELEGLRSTLDATRAVIAEMQESADSLASRSANAQKRLTDLQAVAAEHMRAYESAILEADPSLQSAIRIARQAKQSITTASSAADQRMRDASDKLSLASPDAQTRSPFKTLSEDRWQGGHLRNEAAHAEFLIGRVMVERFMLSRDTADVLATLPEELTADFEKLVAHAEQRDTLRQEAIDALRSAVSSLERSARDLNRNWTIAAQLGGAHYLLSLVEDTRHRDTAILNYQAAVDGRESEPYAEPFVDRLKQLRRN